MSIETLLGLRETQQHNTQNCHFGHMRRFCAFVGHNKNVCDFLFFRINEDVKERERGTNTNALVRKSK